MSKYEPLWRHLEKDGRPTIRMIFDEIEAVLDFPIDHAFLSAKREAAAYGYVVAKISIKEKHVNFEKIR